MRKLLKFLLISDHLNIFAYSLFGPLYALFVLKIGGSAFHAGASWGLYMFIAGISMFYFSRFEDSSKKCRRTMIVISYFILAFGSLAFLLVRVPFQLYMVQIVNALGIGMLDPAWKAVYGKFEDKGKEAEEWALYEGVDKILIAIAALLGGIFITYLSFTYLFLIIFVIQIIAAFMSMKILKN
jgi:MFS family permease